jgi:uncharacterized protein
VDLSRVAAQIKLETWQVERVVELLDADNTVPFITRYRKDQTGGLDETQIREIESAVNQARELAERKQFILRSIESQGKLNEELARRIEAAHSPKLLEDLYLPFKPKRQSLAAAAREKGLEPLADEILDGTLPPTELETRAAEFASAEDPNKVDTTDAVIDGVGHILAERFSERPEVRGKLRKTLRRTGKIVCEKVEGVEGDKAKEFKDFFSFSEPIEKLPPHRILAINRGERTKALKVKIDADTAEMREQTLAECVPEGHPYADLLAVCADDALERLLVPSLDRELRRELTERAENHAVGVFARNLRNLLLQPPARGHRILAIDPGFRSGCKLAALDEHGNLLANDVMFLVGKEERKAEAGPKLVSLVEQHKIDVIAIGNGTGCREVEQLVADAIAGPLSTAEPPVSYVIVNEAGASVYSASNVAREELPDLDATARGTLSIGRRLLDPLAELVKIEPQHVGVGLYQHDVKQKHLHKSLEDVVESCVNTVGVDVNTASAPLLRYVAGLNQLVARNIIEYRKTHGGFKTRADLMQVEGLGPKRFEQAAGFLKLPDGENPLESTWIHPENYETATKVLAKVEATPDVLRDTAKLAEVSQKLKALDLDALATELEVGRFMLGDIVADLQRPGRDPRESSAGPVFKRGVITVDDLKPGMELSGTVLNVVDFGAFVDIGLKESGLVHISELANRFVRNPHDVVAVGDVVKVWVLSIDENRSRVSLSMIPPGAKKPQPPRGERAPRGEGGPRPPREGGGERPPARQGAGGGESRGPRPPRRDGQAGGERRRTPSGPPPSARVPGPPASRKPAGRGGPGDKRGGNRSNKRQEDEQPVDASTPIKPLKKAPPKPGIGKKFRTEANEPLRSFGDLKSLLEQKDEPQPNEVTPPESAAPPSNAPATPDIPLDVEPPQAHEPPASDAAPETNSASEDESNKTEG